MTRLALVGYGRIAPKHLAAFRAHGVEFVAACNRSEEGRRRAREEGGIESTYESIDEMLDASKPDGVVCCASFDQLGTASAKIIERGTPVLIEKPPGIDLAGYEKLRELAKTHETPVMVGFNRRHYSVVNKAIEDAGGVDAITGVSVVWSEDPVHLRKRFTDAQIKYWVFANSIHGLDLMVYLGGAIATPQITTVDRGELKWSMALNGVSDRGALCTFESHWNAPGRWRVSFTTDGRQYTFAPLESCVVMEHGVKGTRTLEPNAEDSQFKPGFHSQAASFVEAVRTRNVPAKLSLDAAEPSMRLAEALTAALIG